MFEEDLDLFFEDFAQDVVFTLPDGARTVKAIFNTPEQSVAIYDVTIEVGKPYLTMKTSDTVGIRKQMPVTVGAQSFKVAKVTHDGTGTTAVYLE